MFSEIAVENCRVRAYTDVDQFRNLKWSKLEGKLTIVTTKKKKINQEPR